MDTMYLVCEYGGMYDDEKFEHYLVASKDKEKCNEFVLNRKLRNQLLNELKSILRDWESDYHIKNPMKESFDLKPIKKFPSGTKNQDITPEMRAEREETIKQNEEIQQANNDLWGAYHNELAIKRIEFIKTLKGIDPEDVEKLVNWDHYIERRHSIETIKVI